MPVHPAFQQSRIIPVDAARGLVMLMVFLAHIKQHFEVSAPTLHWWLLSTTRIATPTFLLLSGFVVRLLLRTDTRGKTSVMLIDRGLFLLTVGHVLLGLDNYSQMSFTDWMFNRIGPVEAIGFGLCIAVLLRNRSARECAAFGIGVFAMAWMLEMSAIRRNIWVSSSDLPLAELNTAVDALNGTELLNEVGIFLIGVALGARLHIESTARDYAFIGRRLFFFGAAAVLSTLGGIIAWHFVKDDVMQLASPEIGGVVRRTLDPRMKDPPSPGYLLFYGGAGLIVVSIFFRSLSNRFVQGTANITSVIGRASLMCFIVQDWLFFGVPHALGLDTIRSIPFWFAYLAVCIALLFWLAHWWGRIRGNRFLTVGLKYLDRQGKLPLSRWRTPDLNA